MGDVTTKHINKTYRTVMTEHAFVLFDAASRTMLSSDAKEGRYNRKDNYPHKKVKNRQKTLIIWMSALGRKKTSAYQSWSVRFAPESGHIAW